MPGPLRLSKHLNQRVGRAGVRRTADFRRIENLPRRPGDWETGDYDYLVEAVSEHFAKPGGEMVLRPIQAAAIHEAIVMEGLIGAIAVGRGKALISLLIATALVEHGLAKRPLIILPASLEHQTRTEVIPEMRKHWRITRELRLFSYESLSSMSSYKALYNISPDAIIADEGHKLKDPKAARTNRFLRYFEDYPDTLFFLLSATILKRSLNDYAHLAELALGIESPLPLEPNDLTSWCYALDSDVDSYKRVEPGALWRFVEPEEQALDPNNLEDDEKLRIVREGWQKRFSETPGVIATKVSEIDIPLVIRERHVDVPQSIRDAIKKLRDEWQTPGGEDLIDGLQMSRALLELACGFYYRWNPEPPIEWRRARSLWAKWCRDYIRYRGRHQGADTEGLVKQRLEEGLLKSAEYDEWRKIEPSFKPNTETVWIDDFLVRDSEKWAKENKGIVWVSHRAFGHAIKSMPYYGGGKQASIDINARQYVGSCAASLKSHSEGKNLQFGYSKNLVVSPPKAGTSWEQLLGRTHRSGQKADEIVCDIYQHTVELWASFQSALRDVENLECHMGMQKLGHAVIDVKSELEVIEMVHSGDPLWDQRD